MVIFWYEMRQLRKSIIIWSLILSITILLLLPVYIDMVIVASDIPMESLGGNSFFDSIGTSAEILMTPVGIYSFLSFFIMFVCAVHAMNMGLNMMTKEYRQSSADFLMTKPLSRSNVYISKFAASACASFIIGSVYFTASWGAMLTGTNDNFSMTILTLIAVSIILVQLIFLALGMLVGAAFPKIRTSLSISAGVVFLTYATGSVGRITGAYLLGYFSPLHYFNGAAVIATGGYESRYVILFVILLLLLVIAGRQIFLKKDVMLVS